MIRPSTNVDIETMTDQEIVDSLMADGLTEASARAQLGVIRDGGLID